MATVAFANSVRDACPACAWASGAADATGRSRTLPRFPCLPSDRRSPARPFRILSFGGRGGRVSVAWGISRPGEGRPADPCRFCIRNGKESISPLGGRRRILYETDMKAHKGASPSRRTRRSSFPRPPRVAHQEISGKNAFCPRPPPPDPSWSHSDPGPRTRRSNRPRQPSARRGSAEAAHEGGAESPDRAAGRRAAPRRADSFFGKNAFPP